MPGSPPSSSSSRSRSCMCFFAKFPSLAFLREDSRLIGTKSEKNKWINNTKFSENIDWVNMFSLISKLHIVLLQDFKHQNMKHFYWNGFFWRTKIINMVMNLNHEKNVGKILKMLDNSQTIWSLLTVWLNWRKYR